MSLRTEIRAAQTHQVLLQEALDAALRRTFKDLRQHWFLGESLCLDFPMPDRGLTEHQEQVLKELGWEPRQVILVGRLDQALQAPIVKVS